MRITLTTLAADDIDYCDRLQTSLVRGSNELLYWGVGPQLARGDLVALFTPKSPYLPDSEHSRVWRLYFAAADSTPLGSPWKQQVFLHRRLDLRRPLDYHDLTHVVGLPPARIYNAGRIEKHMDDAMSTALLAELGRRCAGGRRRLAQLAREATAAPKVAISYAGEDWTRAHRLKLWLDQAGLTPFFVSPVGPVLPHEHSPLAGLLRKSFSGALLAVCLVPSTPRLSKWVRLEIKAAVSGAKRVLLVRSTSRRLWRSLPQGPNVRRLTFGKARERELLEEIKKNLEMVTPNNRLEQTADARFSPASAAAQS